MVSFDMMRLASIPRTLWRVHFLLLGLLTAVPAQAATGWEVVAIAAPDGALAFCRAELYDPSSNLTLAVALSPKNEVNIGIKIPDGGFTKGEGFDVTLGLDNDWKKKVVAESAMAELLLIRLGTADEFLKRMSKADVLRIVGDADATEFKLKGSAKAVEQLRDCVKTAGKGGSGNASATAAMRDEGFPLGLAALLQASQLTVKPVLLPDVPGRAVDYAWTTKAEGKDIEGGFREMPNAAGDLAGLAASQLAPYKKECGADNVKPGKVEVLATLSLQTADVACKKEFAAFLFYRTNTNIFAVVIHRGDKAAAIRAREQVAATVRRLGKEEKQ